MTIQELKTIDELCKELKIDNVYNDIDFAGKLILDLVNIKLFKVGDLKYGRIAAPNPEDYKRGGKYDRDKN